MKQNPLQEITQELAGHISQPMEAHEIAKELETAEYSAGLIMTHLLRLLDYGVCDWEENEDGWWNTDCGNAFEFTDGSPIYNEFKCCPYCGKTLTETPYSEDDESLPNTKS